MAEQNNTIGSVTTTGKRNKVRIVQKNAIGAPRPADSFLDGLRKLVEEVRSKPELPAADVKKVEAEARRIEAELKAEEPQRDFVESAVARIGQLLRGVLSLAPAAQRLGELLGTVWSH